jgi:orotate phosphoribosyltransferase
VTKSKIRQILQEKGSLYPSELGHHFVGISGKHLSGYCNIDPALPDIDFIAEVTRLLVSQFEAGQVDTVLVPATGAIPLAQWGPHFLKLRSGKPVLGIWADKIKPRGFVIQRAGFAEAIAGRNVLILEDMINQMYSVKELVRLTRELGGNVVGVGALVANRTATRDQIGVEQYVRMCEFSYDAWDAANCALCANGIPIVIDEALGHGKEFQELNPVYPGGFISLLKPSGRYNAISA